jgi:hypothetical protein
VASIERATPMKALDLADSLAENLASRPAMAEATEITTRERSVLIRMDLDEQQLASSLRAPMAPVPQSAEPHDLVSVAAAPVKPQPRAFVPPTAQPSAAPQAVTNTLSAAIPDVAVTELLQQRSPQMNLPPAPARPKTIKIIGLDSGPREIPLGH